ncbi:hypothetical protein [Actinomadura chokoriensis]|uniref:hypothetical protein n=1 Tax=Actinomadura chokoriensis TaxID=454156 RepID=UPI0031F759BB
MSQPQSAAPDAPLIVAAGGRFGQCQIGSLTSAYQQVVSGTFLAVVVVRQRYLSRLQRAA